MHLPPRTLFQAKRSTGRSSTFGPCVRPISKIPALVIYPHRRYVVTRKWNFHVTPDLYNAALTGGDLFERSAVPEFHRDYLITDAGLGISFEVIDKSIGNLN
jgi:hypothetical protein